MKEITVTLPLTNDVLDFLKGYIDLETKEVAKEQKAKPKAKIKKVKEPEQTSMFDKEVTITDVRAIGLKLAKEGKQDILKETLEAYGAAKLTDIKPEDLAKFKADLEAKL